MKKKRTRLFFNEILFKTASHRNEKILNSIEFQTTLFFHIKKAFAKKIHADYFKFFWSILLNQSSHGHQKEFIS
jgi:hypothetical protein